jgi:hypothetical protein
MCELDEPEDRLRVLEQDLAGLGEGDGAPSFRALDEPMTDPPLQQRDLLADRGLRESEPGGCRSE